jgi:Skp family chaperone for outer membrane proteins
MKNAKSLIADAEERIQNSETLHASLYSGGDEFEDTTDTPNVESPVEQAEDTEGAGTQEITQEEEAVQEQTTHNAEPDFKSQLESMRGRLESERTRKDGIITQLQKEIKNLTEALIESNKSKSIETKPEEQSAGLQTPSFDTDTKFDMPKEIVDPFTKAEREEWGDEQLNLIVRGATHVVNTMLQSYNKNIMTHIARLQNDVVERISSVSAVVEETKRGTFFDELSKMVPDWAQYNEDPGFLQWLQNDYFDSGFKRIDILTKAQNDGNAKRAAKMFSLYIEELGQDNSVGTSADFTYNQPTVIAEPVQVVTPVMQQNVPSIPDSLITSGSNRTTQTIQRTPEKPIRHLSELKRGVEQVRRGKMTLATFNVLQDEIDQARAEGRLEP